MRSFSFPFFSSTQEKQALLPPQHAATQQVNQRLQRIGRNDRLLQSLGVGYTVRHLAGQEGEWQTLLNTLLDPDPPLLAVNADGPEPHITAGGGDQAQTQALARLGELLLEHHHAVGLNLFVAGANGQCKACTVDLRSGFLRRCLQAMANHPWVALSDGQLEALQIHVLECHRRGDLTLEEVQSLSHRATQVEARSPVARALTALGATGKAREQVLQQTELCQSLEEFLSGDSPALQLSVDADGQLHCTVPRCEAAGGRFDQLAALALQLRDMGIAGATHLLAALCLAVPWETQEIRLLTACGKALLSKDLRVLLPPETMKALQMRARALVTGGRLAADWNTFFDDIVRDQEALHWQRKNAQRLVSSRARVLAWLPELDQQALDAAVLQRLEQEPGATPERARERSQQWESYLSALVCVPEQCPPWDGLEAMARFSASAFPEQRDPWQLADLNLLYGMHNPERLPQALSRFWSRLDEMGAQAQDGWVFLRLESVLGTIEGLDAKDWPEQLKRLRQHLPPQLADSLEQRVRTWWLNKAACTDPAAAQQRLEVLLKTEPLQAWSAAQRRQLLKRLLNLPPAPKARLLKAYLAWAYDPQQASTQGARAQVDACARAFRGLARGRSAQQVMASLLKRLANEPTADAPEWRPLIKGLLRDLLNHPGGEDALLSNELMRLLADVLIVGATPLETLDNAIDLVRHMHNTLYDPSRATLSAAWERANRFEGVLCGYNASRPMGEPVKDLHHLFLLQAAWQLRNHDTTPTSELEPGAQSLGKGELIRPTYLGLVHTRLGQRAQMATTGQRWQATLEAHQGLVHPDKQSLLALSWRNWEQDLQRLNLLMAAVQNA